MGDPLSGRIIIFQVEVDIEYLISFIPATLPLEKKRSTHIARKLDGEGGSPRYMAPECAWDHKFREGVMSS